MGLVLVGVIPPLGVAASISNSARSSAAVCHRSAGFFSRQRMIVPAIAGGTAGRWSVTGRGCSVTCAASTICGLKPVNGGQPVSNS